MPDMHDAAHAPQGAAAPCNRWIADIRKNLREVVRVELSTFRGVELLNVRVWFDAGGGELRPGKSGLALRVEKLPELQAAIAKAIAAKSAGLI